MNYLKSRILITVTILTSLMIANSVGAGSREAHISMSGFRSEITKLFYTAQAAKNPKEVRTLAEPKKKSSRVVPAAAPKVIVYKSPTCGCCVKWGEHLLSHGFRIEANDRSDSDLSRIRASNRVPPKAASCHTALVGDYVVEGHVPADLIHRLLKERPKIAGIAVPGMPMGSPGMEGATSERYDVLSFDRQGNLKVYASR